MGGGPDRAADRRTPALRAATTVRWTLAATLCASAACSSPESERARGGGPGADPGNRDAVVEIHGGAEMYHGVDCELAVKCSGPEAVFGIPERDSASSD